MRSLAPSSWLLRLTLLGAVLIAAHGCADVTVRPASSPGPLDSGKDSTILGEELSLRSRQTLRRCDLEDDFQREPDEALRRLHAAALKDTQSDILFALAEINYIRGRQIELRSPTEAQANYYLCAGCAYHFLFDDLDARKDGGANKDIFDPRFRLACDLYNASLSKYLRTGQKTGRMETRALSIEPFGFAWKPEEFGSLVFAADYVVTGLANHYRTYGLGVPLIGQHVGPASHDYVPKEARFPVTAFLHFEGGLADLDAKHVGRLELYNSRAIQTVEVRGHTVPLEADLTTPLAYYLAHSGLDNLEYKLFLTPDAIGDRGGLRMLEPYQPGKIPVVLVHGLLSTPLTWADALNDLIGDPVLRQRFQFWTYFYPSSQPYLVTAAELRRALTQVRQDVDSQHRDAAFDDMVLVGHSMGGLVAKLLTIDSGDDFRALVSAKPLDRLKLHSETRSELEQVVYFDPLPQIRRVVFIATPHGGSQMSASLLGRLGEQLAGMPRREARTLDDLTKENPGRPALAESPTSIEELAPGSAMLAALAAKKRPTSVHYHSIIGVTPETGNPVEAWLTGVDAQAPGDGVVSYKSAHLEDADSEVIVPADHLHVHHHPRAIRELRRILLEHYRDIEARGGN